MVPAQIINDNLWHCFSSSALFLFAGRRVTDALQDLGKAKCTARFLLYSRKHSVTLPNSQWLRCSSSLHHRRSPFDSEFFHSRVDLEKTAKVSNIEDTYEKLKIWSHRANYVQVQAFVDRLVRIYGERPNNRIYEALILANADALHGSPAEVRKILQEMKEEGVSVGSGIYHAALKVRSFIIDRSLSLKILGAGCPSGSSTSDPHPPVPPPVLVLTH